MSRYRTYGKLDDQFVTEGDSFFKRMNARLRPNQLQPGDVALSENGRMEKDGTWQTRKGLLTLAGSITLDGDSINLPYTIVAASRQNDLVILTLAETPPINFVEGNDISIAGLGFTSLDPNGTHTLFQANFVNKRLIYEQTGVDETFTVSGESIVGPGSSFATELPFDVSTIATNEVYGSCVFSDPNSENTDDYIFTATNNLIQILRLRDKAEFRVRYPTGQVVTNRVDMIQAFDKILLFRAPYTNFECKPVLQSRSISSASRVNTTITVNTIDAHNLSDGDFVTLLGLGNFSLGGNPNDIYQVANTSTYSFEVTFNTTHVGTETYTISGASAEYFNDFTYVTNGQYTLPAYITDSAASITNSVCEISETNHGLELGQELTIVNITGSFESLIGQKVRVSEIPDDDTFRFTLQAVDTASISISLTKKQPTSYFVHQPSAPFGVMNQRRLWLPYFYEEDNYSPISWTDRGKRDEIIASDILDDSTFDVISSQFRVTGGSNDFVVGIEPFTEDTLLVLCRRSIHRLQGASGSLADVGINVVTPDLGCAARRSVVQVGNQILFLSDQGVYALSFQDEYNLRGTEVPLSESIQPYIDRINQRYIGRSVGAYFNNRYYLAVPLDFSAEANVILVYNFINQGWESIDTVDSLQWNIRDMLVAREEEQNFLYVTTSEGGIHRMEGFDGSDTVSVQAGVSEPETLAVRSKLVSREYDLATLDRKAFNRSEIHIKSDKYSESDADITFSVTDPDRTQSPIALRDMVGGRLGQNEDASLRSRIRLNGFGCSTTIQPTIGRPFVRAIKVEGRIADRSTTSTI
jgi:hypothetical protein